MIKKLTMSEMNRLSIEDFKDAEKTPVVVVLDNIRSQHNIGSIFRTADAFRVYEIHLCGITATPPNREIQKSALGSTDSVNWKYFDSTAASVKSLKDKGYIIVAIEQASGSIMIDDFLPNPENKYALVFGNEVHGIEDDIMDSSDICLEIPQAGTKHSLNVSVSAGIVIWDIFVKMDGLNKVCKKSENRF